MIPQIGDILAKVVYKVPWNYHESSLLENNRNAQQLTEFNELVCGFKTLVLYLNMRKGKRIKQRKMSWDHDTMSSMPLLDFI